MSTDYFLVCKTHKIATYITDNKGNRFLREDMREFLLHHRPGTEGCNIILEDEHTIEDCDIIWGGEVIHSKADAPPQDRYIELDRDGMHKFVEAHPEFSDWMKENYGHF